MRGERKVDKEKEKQKEDMKKGRETDKLKEENINPFPSNTLLTLPNLSASTQFEHRQVLILCIYKTHNPN